MMGKKGKNQVHKNKGKNNLSDEDWAVLDEAVNAIEKEKEEKRLAFINSASKSKHLADWLVGKLSEHFQFHSEVQDERFYEGFATHSSLDLMGEHRTVPVECIKACLAFESDPQKEQTLVFSINFAAQPVFRLNPEARRIIERDKDGTSVLIRNSINSFNKDPLVSKIATINVGDDNYSFVIHPPTKQDDYEYNDFRNMAFEKVILIAQAIKHEFASFTTYANSYYFLQIKYDVEMINAIYKDSFPNHSYDVEEGPLTLGYKPSNQRRGPLITLQISVKDYEDVQTLNREGENIRNILDTTFEKALKSENFAKAHTFEGMLRNSVSFSDSNNINSKLVLRVQFYLEIFKTLLLERKPFDARVQHDILDNLIREHNKKSSEIMYITHYIYKEHPTIMSYIYDPEKSEYILNFPTPVGEDYRNELALIFENHNCVSFKNNGKNNTLSIKAQFDSSYPSFEKMVTFIREKIKLGHLFEKSLTFNYPHYKFKNKMNEYNKLSHLSGVCNSHLSFEQKDKIPNSEDSENSRFRVDFTLPIIDMNTFPESLRQSAKVEDESIRKIIESFQSDDLCLVRPTAQTESNEAFTIIGDKTFINSHILSDLYEEISRYLMPSDTLPRTLYLAEKCFGEKVKALSTKYEQVLGDTYCEKGNPEKRSSIKFTLDLNSEKPLALIAKLNHHADLPGDHCIYSGFDEIEKLSQSNNDFSLERYTVEIGDENCSDLQEIFKFEFLPSKMGLLAMDTIIGAFENHLMEKYKLPYDWFLRNEVIKTKINSINELSQERHSMAPLLQLSPDCDHRDEVTVDIHIPRSIRPVKNIPNEVIAKLIETQNALITGFIENLNACYAERGQLIDDSENTILSVGLSYSDLDGLIKGLNLLNEFISGSFNQIVSYPSLLGIVENAILKSLSDSHNQISLGDKSDLYINFALRIREHTQTHVLNKIREFFNSYEDNLTKGTYPRDSSDDKAVLIEFGLDLSFGVLHSIIDIEPKASSDLHDLFKFLHEYKAKSNNNNKLTPNKVTDFKIDIPQNSKQLTNTPLVIPGTPENEEGVQTPERRRPKRMKGNIASVADSELRVTAPSGIPVTPNCKLKKEEGIYAFVKKVAVKSENIEGDENNQDIEKVVVASPDEVNVIQKGMLHIFTGTLRQSGYKQLGALMVSDLKSQDYIKLNEALAGEVGHDKLKSTASKSDLSRLSFKHEIDIETLESGYPNYSLTLLENTWPFLCFVGVYTGIDSILETDKNALYLHIEDPQKESDETLANAKKSPVYTYIPCIYNQYLVPTELRCPIQFDCLDHNWSNGYQPGRRDVIRLQGEEMKLHENSISCHYFVLPENDDEVGNIQGNSKDKFKNLIAKLRGFNNACKSAGIKVIRGDDAKNFGEKDLCLYTKIPGESQRHHLLCIEQKQAENVNYFLWSYYSQSTNKVDTGEKPQLAESRRVEGMTFEQRRKACKHLTFR